MAVLRERFGVAGAVAFDAITLGMGDDGHTASLFPGMGTVGVSDRLVLAVAAQPDKGLEARLTLSFEKDESVLKSAAPAASPEAKEALRQGKLPREARLRLTTGEREFAFTFKGATLGLASVAIPAELKDKGDEMHEVFYERMRLLEELSAVLEALWADFLTLRLGEAWDASIVPLMKRFAHQERVDGAVYLQIKKRALGKKSTKPKG